MKKVDKTRQYFKNNIHKLYQSKRFFGLRRDDHLKRRSNFRWLYPNSEVSISIEQHT